MKKTIAAIVLSYNDPRVFALINCLAGQRLQFDEIIVVDDGSDDIDLDAVRVAISQFANVTYHFKKSNKGVNDSIKFALSIVQSEYFYLLSSGDEYVDDLLSEFKRVEDDFHPGIIAAGIKTYRAGQPSQTREYKTNFPTGYLFYGEELSNVLAHSPNVFFGGGCFIKTSLARNITHNFERLSWASDFFIYYFCAITDGVVFIDAVLMTQVLEDGQYSNSGKVIERANVSLEFIDVVSALNNSAKQEFKSAAILPNYSLMTLVKLCLSKKSRWYLSFRLLSKFTLHVLGYLFSRFVPFSLQRKVRGLLRC